MKTVWVKLLIYLSISFLAPYLAFIAGTYDAWTTDRTVRLDVPAWVWFYITLQATVQTLIVLRAYIDRSFAMHTDEVTEEADPSPPPATGQTPPVAPP